MTKTVSLIACALVFSAATAYADCATLGRQAKEDDGRLNTAMEEYQKFARSIPKNNTPTPDQLAKAISASVRFIEAIDRSIASLERGDGEGCFGTQAAAWKKILADLKSKRIEFEAERQTLLKAASVARPTIPKAEWKSFLGPSMQAFTVCIVQTKRRALAVADKKPTPQDFALIMRGACNTEAVAIDAEQSKIEDWTSENRREIKQALDGVRARAVSEYSESFYGMR